MSFSVVEDPAGGLIFGANSLLTFNNERWTSTPVDGAYGFRGLDIDSRGRLWVATVGELGWFERTPQLEWEFHSLRAFLPPSSVPLSAGWHVFAEREGAVFVTVDQVLRWDGTKFEAWPMPGKRRLPAMRLDGTIYVHFVAQGLFALEKSGPMLVIPQSILGGEEAAILWMEKRGSAWLLAMSSGLYLYEAGVLREFAPETSQLLRRDRLTAGVRLRDGRYAFGTYRGGIVFMQADGSLDNILNEEAGLPTRYITSLFVDREGKLWATSPSRILRIELDLSSVVFDERAHLPTQAYRSIARLDGRILLGSENGIYELGADQRTFTPSPATEELVYDIRETPAGVLASGMHWVKRLSDGAAIPITPERGDIFAIMPSRRSPDHLFLSKNNTIVSSSGGRARLLIQNLPDIARSIAEDHVGNLWLGTIARGLLYAQIDANRAVEAVPVSQALGLPALKGRCFVRATPTGGILVFADNGGWMKPAGRSEFQRIRNYPERGLGAASEIGADNVGWVAHVPSPEFAACVARIRIEGDQAEWEPHSVPGLATIGPPRSLYIEADAQQRPILWVGGTKSVLRHVVAHGPRAPKPLPPILRAFARSAKSDAALPIVEPLPYSTTAITFEFAAPEFSRREALRLQTRIDGIDREWVPAGPDSIRVLTALRDGRYTFHVRSVAETGVASEPAVFRFRVLPPFWRTAPFALLVVVTLLPVACGLYLMRIRTLRHRTAELEKKVRDRTEELEAANAAKTQFVANMSHDIRNPLNGIVGLALALEDTRLDTRQREIVATLRECTTYLSSLVDDVLDFASIEAGRVELRPGPFVPAELLKSIVETLKADTAESGAWLAIEAATDVPDTVVGDAGRIQQILVNFVSNALKYAGGHIRLSVSLPAGHPDEIEFAVADEGPGISEEERATLFTKFSRLRQKHGSEDIPGAGLGLAACRLLADLMGGSVDVESRPGAGARFHLRLPLTIGTKPVIPTTTHLPNTTVLVVEDADYNAWAAEAVLARLGLRSERAHTGAEALALFGARRYNVVLLDRSLPDMDGTEVARRMREMESDGRQSLLLAVTAYCTAEDRALCLQAGMDTFIGKPLTPEKLRKVLLAAGRRLLASASVQAPQAGAAVDVDLQLLNYLADGTNGGLEVQIERFITSLDQGYRDLVEANGVRDYDRLARCAHQFLGQARIVGATALGEAALRLEAAARTEDSKACRTGLELVNAGRQALTAAMRRRRGPSVRST